MMMTADGEGELARRSFPSLTTVARIPRDTRGAKRLTEQGADPFEWVFTDDPNEPPLDG